MISAKGGKGGIGVGSKGQQGGICIGSGSAKAGEISINGKIYKEGDPEYDQLYEQIMKDANNSVFGRMKGIFVR